MHAIIRVLGNGQGWLDRYRTDVAVDSGLFEKLAGYRAFQRFAGFDKSGQC